MPVLKPNPFRHWKTEVQWEEDTAKAESSRKPSLLVDSVVLLPFFGWLTMENAQSRELQGKLEQEKPSMPFSNKVPESNMHFFNQIIMMRGISLRYATGFY